MVTAKLADHFKVDPWRMFEAMCKLGQRRLVAFTTVNGTRGVFWYATTPDQQKGWPKQPNPFHLIDAAKNGSSNNNKSPSQGLSPQQALEALRELEKLEDLKERFGELSRADEDKWFVLRILLGRAGLLPDQPPE